MIPMSKIRAFARRIAAEFKPQRIILFGSHAYGKPTGDSDVDILVVMPSPDTLDQAVRIRQHIDAPFPLDLVVRDPHELAWRLKEHDWFLLDIVEKGKILYEAPDGRAGEESGGRLRDGQTRTAGTKVPKPRRSVLSRAAVRRKVP